MLYIVSCTDTVHAYSSAWQQHKQFEASVISEKNVACAGGFANSPLRPTAADKDNLSTSLQQLVADVRAQTGLHPGQAFNLRQLMKSGCLAGQPVQFRSRHGDHSLTGNCLPNPYGHGDM